MASEHTGGQHRLHQWRAIIKLVLVQGKLGLTGSPQHLALAVHAGTDSSVAVGGAILTRLSVLQEDIGGTVGRGSCAKLGQITLSERLATHGARRSQLRRGVGSLLHD